MAAQSMLLLIGMFLASHATICVADVCDTSQLIPCLPAAKPNPEPPTGQCCNLIHALTSDCLCAALQSPLAKVEGVDFLLALQLPHKCGRMVPKGTKCGDATVPNSLDHEEDHNGAMEGGMEHQAAAAHASNSHEAMELRIEHQESTAHATKHLEATDIGHHDAHGTMEDRTDGNHDDADLQHVTADNNGHRSEHELEDGMEH
ncbi:hypothetical protein MPTK1_1g04740 [Marchantia polymorpha subsp. ruderalis]|uniref:Bifunctional inhibitor/plant lipid transfer protein/seed storage helical domain-containing protein n=2 Tax=Marchantia polymorpha TaxID=3197 RepID=A0A176VFN3_MARPO|nr:hypothetical protein AXG93_1923s1630 [Marchantia polymorpha subsp. ruderalis]PTQ48494.1 hypothetical protein MARPO_0005s0134 [Marchantia polymorpha]BBM97314.1 hypothetical protein Mp_1g04740 [Marchantia polymorpha subsp. ruderalis]|eukprot:PTQ48494.1 hypothetical protein MARPO_0005s0134 [Marchantia polymorpha]